MGLGEPSGSGLPQPLLPEERLADPLQIHAPEPSPRRSPWRGWVAAQAVVRPSIAVGPAGAIGVVKGDASGAIVALRLLLPRPTRFGPDSTLGEIEADLLAFKVAAGVRLAAGGGVAVRRYVQAGEVAKAHPIARLIGEGGYPLAIGGWGIEPGVTIGADLGVSRIGIGTDRRILFPFSIGLGLKIGPNGEPRTGRRTSGRGLTPPR